MALRRGDRFTSTSFKRLDCRLNRNVSNGEKTIKETYRKIGVSGRRCSSEQKLKNARKAWKLKLKEKKHYIIRR